MSDSPRLKTVCIATPSVIGPRAVSTGIVKQPIEGKIQVTEMGLEGDFQVDSRVHGGLDKAVYQFPFETYTTLAEAFPHLADRFSSPCVGENLSSSGMTDNTVYIGDCYRVGSALLQVSQPRMPCWKLNQHVGNSHVMALLVSLMKTGWYYRVLETGHVSAGDTFILEDRLQEAWTVEAIWTHWLDLRAQKKQVVGSVPVPGLSTQWRFDW
ncbi:MOSC domain-containing protein [Enterovibrio sp. ZSDZ35]|uniref:MOSC domain-containing protein n=1 Tax=Enterovibrio qingdaonensis TaxID=2899818 RepID=A0ABT5QKR3_9GAMM|nr:MOSC domain-containing protein [Enterovibrio sp. ZSDZ35]MDD1781568.1 MOSC domain-containing protein [Enterovibrio sp. ZSDZ35]